MKIVLQSLSKDAAEHVVSVAKAQPDSHVIKTQDLSQTKSRIGADEAALVLVGVKALDHENGTDLRGLQQLSHSFADEKFHIIAMIMADGDISASSALHAGVSDVCKLNCHPDEIRARIVTGFKLVSHANQLYQLKDSRDKSVLNDQMTGLMNRSAFLEKLDAELARTERRGETLILSLLDIDQIASVNARYGEAAGDSVLKALGGHLKTSMREGDIAARLGGKEFALCLPETDLGEGQRVLERLRRKLAALIFPIPGDDFSITVSIGIAEYKGAEHKTQMDAHALINRADRALLSAKDGGGNRVEIYQG